MPEVLYHPERFSEIELKSRQFVALDPIPHGIPMYSRHFGISLDNNEAQDFLTKGFRVFGDDQGPYLVIRLKSGQPWPILIDPNDCDITVQPIEWSMAGHPDRYGVICWLKEIS